MSHEAAKVELRFHESFIHGNQFVTVVSADLSGTYVPLADYEALRAELEARKAENEQLKEQFQLATATYDDSVKCEKCGGSYRALFQGSCVECWQRIRSERDTLEVAAFHFRECEDCRSGEGCPDSFPYLRLLDQIELRRTGGTDGD